MQSLVLPHVKSAGAKYFRYSTNKMELSTDLKMQENFLFFKHAVKKNTWTELERREEEAYIFTTSFHFILSYLVF